MFVAIIVIYYPEIEHVQKMYAELSKAGVHVIVFDNTPKQDAAPNHQKSIASELKEGDDLFVLGNGSNVGLASGFNRSIECAKKEFENIEGFIFFDQDSYINSQQINSLLAEYFYLINKH